MGEGRRTFENNLELLSKLEVLLIFTHCRYVGYNGEEGRQDLWGEKWGGEEAWVEEWREWRGKGAEWLMIAENERRRKKITHGARAEANISGPGRSG